MLTSFFLCSTSFVVLYMCSVISFYDIIMLCFYEHTYLFYLLLSSQVVLFFYYTRHLCFVSVYIPLCFYTYKQLILCFLFQCACSNVLFVYNMQTKNAHAEKNICNMKQKINIQKNTLLNMKNKRSMHTKTKNTTHA